MNTKVCGTCKVSFPLSTEYFSKDSSKRGGLKTVCKSCERIRNHERYLKTKEEHARKGKAYYHAHKENAYRQSSQWKRDHPEAIREQYKKYRQANLEKILDKAKEYRESHRKELREKSRQYYHANIKTCVESRYRWQKNNRSLCSVATQRYRSRKRNLESTLTKEQWDSAKEAFDNKCAYCGRERHLEQEHFVSVSNEGTFTRENIIPACRSCNCSKLNRNFFEWYPTYRHYSKQREDKIKQYLSAY